MSEDPGEKPPRQGPARPVSAGGHRARSGVRVTRGIDAEVLTAAKTIVDRAVGDGHGPDGLARLTTTLRKAGRP